MRTNTKRKPESIEIVNPRLPNDDGADPAWMPTIPDILGWVLGFFVVFALYTIVQNGVDLVQSTSKMFSGSETAVSSGVQQDSEEAPPSYVDRVADDAYSTVDSVLTKLEKWTGSDS